MYGISCVLYVQVKQMKLLTKRFEIRLDPKLYDALKRKAAELKVDMSVIVRPGIEFAIRNARAKEGSK